MNQEFVQINQNILNQRQCHKLFLYLTIGTLFIENCLLIIDSIYSIIYQHYELAFMCGLGMFMIMFSLLLLQYLKIFLNYEISAQKNKCKSCDKISLKFQCQVCQICVACHHKFHSKYLNICLDENQFHQISRSIWIIILKCIICIIIKVFALTKYFLDDTKLYYMFLISVIIGFLIDLVMISIFSYLQYQIRNKDKILDESLDNSEILIQVQSNKEILQVKSSTDSIQQQKTNSIDTQLKQFKILDFLEKKLGHQQNSLNSPQINQTDPIMNDDDSNHISQQMNKLSQLIPISMISDNANNVPVLQQINTLNSQPIMQVRRPSDLNSSLTQQPSQHSTHNVQKSPVIIQLDSKAIPLNLINEESSVKEQSDNLAYESLLQKKRIILPTKDYIIKEPVHWSQIFTHPSTNKEENYYNKYAEYLDDYSFEKEQKQNSQFNISNPLIIIIEVLLYIFYLYSISLIIYGVAFTNYKQIYNLQIQLPLLLLNFIIFSIHIQKSSNFFDYLPLATFVPFIATLIDFNEQVIFLQLIHTITFVRFYQIIDQLLNIAICFQIYTIYFILIRISQLHLVQVLCGFILVISSNNQVDQNINQFYQTYSIVNILLTTDNISVLIYPLKIFLILFFIYECTITGEYIIYYQKNKNTIIQGLNEISKIIQHLPFNIRFESIKISKKQIIERINVRNLLDYDKLPEQLQRKLLVAQYQQLFNKIPIIQLCLTEQTIQNILRYATKERVLEPNEMLYEINQENPYLYFLLQGKIRCYQKRGNKQFNLGFYENGIFNQYEFFFSKSSEIGVQCVTCCKVLEVNWELFWREVQRNLNEYEKIKMFLDKVQFNQELKLIAASCLLCKGNHQVSLCKRLHYVPPKQMLLDHIYFDENNQRSQFQRRNIDRKFRCRLNNCLIEQVVSNVRHLLMLSTSTYRKPKTIKTITSLGLQLDQPLSDGSDGEQNKLSQYLQNLSPVPYVAPVGSSASSYMLKELKQTQLKSPKNSFIVHQKRYQEKRQSHVTKIERDLSPSIIKYATIQDKRSQKSKSIISEDHGGILQSSDNRQFSKYGIQSSKFTNETAKQFMNNPFDMPLYDLNLSIDNNQNYSDYFPGNNLDQALLSYKQYQDSIISNRSKHS